MEGDLSLLSIPDLLQMICLGRYNRDIHLYDGPILVGVIMIRQGRVERCIGLGSRGDVAFYKLVGLRRGRYKVHEGKDNGSSDATLSGHSWQELLLEAARRADEARHYARMSPRYAVSFDLPTSSPGTPAALLDFDQFDQAL
jgi:Domain of unknown function (DUF4388)